MSHVAPHYLRTWINLTYYEFWVRIIMIQDYIAKGTGPGELNPDRHTSAKPAWKYGTRISARPILAAVSQLVIQNPAGASIAFPIQQSEVSPGLLCSETTVRPVAMKPSG